jgi:hypothetical protein
MTDRPEPLVPAEVDLRDFKFMPLDVVRLRDSGLTAKATGDEFRAAVLLWCASWHQVPAASLPDDDDELANICGYSRSRREWAKVRVGALRNWTACSDGRLYHAAVAGKALEAWIEKLASAIGGAAGNAKRWNVKIDTDRLRAQFRQAVEALRTIDPQSNTLRKKAVAVLTMPSGGESDGESGGESGGDSHPDRKGQGQGQGQGEEREKTAASPRGPAPSADPPQAHAPDAADVIFGLGLPLLTAAGVSDRNTRSMLGLMRKTHGDDAVIAALQRCATEKPLQPVAWLQAALKAAPRPGAVSKPDAIALHNIGVGASYLARKESAHEA